MSEQYRMQIRLNGKQIANWRERVKPLTVTFRAYLRRRGLSPGHAPEMPPLQHGLQGLHRGPFRIVMMWIPDWVPSKDAGFHVVRIDTVVKA